MKSISPILIFVLLSTIIAYFTHKNLSEKKPEYFIPACFVAGILSSILFQIIGYIVMGYLDPFFLIAFIVGAFISTGISLLVGIVKKQLKKDKDIA